MDPQKFEGVVRKLSGSLSRRSLVGGSVGASVLAAVGLGEEALAKRKQPQVTAEACIPTGKKCPSPKPRGRRGKRRKAKNLSCNQCCQRRVTTNAKGKNICYCATILSACTETRECCDGRCIANSCQVCGLAGEPCSYGILRDTSNNSIPCCSGFFCNQTFDATAGTCETCKPVGATCNPEVVNSDSQCCQSTNDSDPPVFCQPSLADPDVYTCQVGIS